MAPFKGELQSFQDSGIVLLAVTSHLNCFSLYKKIKHTIEGAVVRHLVSII